MKSRIIFLLIFYAVLSLGCFWHIFNVCRLFLDFETNIFIETKFDSLENRLPALSLCMNLNTTNYGLNSTQAIERSSGKFRDSFVYINKIYQSGNKLDITKFYLENSIERVSLKYYCITFNTTKLSEMDPDSASLSKHDKFEISFKDNWGKYQGWWVFLNSGFNLPDSDGWNGYEVKRHSFNLLTWKLSSFRLLESPYQSNCRDYRLSNEYLSRKDCIRKCKIEVSVNSCGVLYDSIDLMRSDPTVQFGESNISSKGCYYGLNYTDICSERCSQYDCAIDYYKTVVLNKTRIKNETLLTLVIPTEPETSYSHQSRIELVEFICYLASTFNMWFGFSMYSLYYLFTVLRNRVKKGFKSKGNDQGNGSFVDKKIDSPNLIKSMTILDKVKGIVILVIYTLLSVGCIYQIIDVCQLYFDFETNIFIDTKFDVLKDRLPALSFCHTLNGTNAGLNSNQAFEIASGQFKYSVFENITKILRGYKRIYLSDPYLADPIERVSYDSYCITFNTTKLSEINSNSASLNIHENIELGFANLEMGQSWWLFLHSGYNLPDYQRWCGYEVKNQTFNKVTWKLTSFRLLKSPYKTNCRDYRLSNKYLSRKDCIRKCKIEVSVKSCGVLYEGIDVMRSDPTVQFGNYGNASQKHCFNGLNFTHICGERCPQFDCTIDHYKPVVLLSTKRLKGTLVQIQIPTEPKISYSHQPRIELVEFICYLASTFNMWFGFSMYSLYYLFTVLRKRVKCKMNKNKTNVQVSLFNKKIISQKLEEVDSKDQVRI